jgi:hypothetical protein
VGSHNVRSACLNFLYSHDDETRSISMSDSSLVTAVAKHDTSISNINDITSLPERLVVTSNYS